MKEVSIPLIDCSEIHGDFNNISTESLEKFANEFGKSLEETGFVYLKNHDLDLEKVEHLHNLSRQFFTLPADTKQTYKKDNALASYNGYIGPGEEFNSDTKNPELKEVWDIWGEDAQNEEKYPAEISGFKSSFDNFRPDCTNLILKLLRSIALYLKLENLDYFIEQHCGISDQKVKTNTQFRVLYYYPLQKIYEDGGIPENAVRCGEHSDWGTLTLLFQDMVGGLEVKTAEGDWIHAVPIENTILVNTGQILEIWTGGRIQATPHRVRILEDEAMLKTARQSLVYFVDPDWESIVQPILPLLPGKEYLANGTPITAYERNMKIAEESLYA